MIVQVHLRNRSVLLYRTTLSWQALACCLVGFVYWYTVGLMMRYTLKMLLMYKGFMFETRGKGISLQTKLWAILVKCKLRRDAYRTKFSQRL